MKKVRGGICAPKGFKAAGIAARIKKSGRPDMALIASDVPATVAGVFTTNKVKAAPIIVSQQNIKSGKCQAIIANAGNANCWTGKKGLLDAWQMVGKTAKVLGIPKKHVLVTSTGVIGKPLPIKKVLKGIPLLKKKLSKNGGTDAAKAILTTDKRVKEIAVKVGDITIAGVAKGSGMIHPNMATMHAFVTTDAIINKSLLQKILKNAVDRSFNMVSVDDCMSTNDCVFALANGLSKSRVAGRRSRVFIKAFEYVCEYLAKAIAADGEGATKLLTVNISGARSYKDALLASKALVNSYLLKAAVFGNDKNMGRILQAVGASGAGVDLDKIKVNWTWKKKEVIINVNLGVGKEKTTAWGCDLSYDYVRINARYGT